LNWARCIYIHLSHLLIVLGMLLFQWLAYHGIIGIFQLLQDLGVEKLKPGIYVLSKIYLPWKLLIGPIIFGIALFGWLPVKRGLIQGRSLRNWPYFLCVALLYRRLPGRRCRPARGHYWSHYLIRMRWILLLTKSYFLPLTIGSLYTSMYFFYLVQESSDRVWNILLIVLAFRNIGFLVDAAFATAGYALESKRWGASFKAVETNWLGWFFCLACYPPMGIIMGLFIGGNLPHQLEMFSPDSGFRIVCVILAVVFLLLYVFSIVAQGLRFANLSYRGTVSRGPFAWIRHPQYTFKILGFFFEWLPFFAYWPNIFFFAGWVGVYVGRALTEERFLSQFEDYRIYKKKVLWRFIPGIL